MALDLIVEYPGQVVAGDPNYPQGRPQNVSVEGDGTGTPFEAALLSDIVGLQQALLKQSGIAPSGAPDNANTSQYLQAFYKLIGRVEGWGALGDGVSDDTAAIQAAIAEYTALGSGSRRELHFSPGKTYLVTGLTLPLNVDLYFHGAALVINHATNPLLTYASTAVSRHPQKVVGARFGAALASTGATVRVTGATVLHFHDCWFGATPNTNGKFVDSSTSFARIAATLCIFEGRSDAPFVDFSTGSLRIDDCRVIVPSTYASSCFKVGGADAAWVQRTHFDVTGHSSGTMACIEVTSAAAVLKLDDNRFLNDTDPAVSVAIKWGANAATIVEQGSTFAGTITPYSGSAVLAQGSALGLLPHGYFTAPSETFTFPDDFRSLAIKGSWGSTLNFTMPAIRFPGQELDLLLLQNGPTDIPDININALGPPAKPIDGGFIRTGRLKAMRDQFQDRWYWAVIGDWSTMFGRAADVT